MRSTSNGTDVSLTQRQRQVVELIALGCSNEEVGERLGILAANGEGALRCPSPEARGAAAAADPCRVQDAHR